MKRFVYGMLVTVSLVWAQSPKTVTPEEASLAYQEVVKKLKDEFVQPIDEKRLMDSCLEGMVNSVDKNGRYFNEEEYETLYLSNTPVAGVGLFLAQKRHHIFVKSVVEHSPAYKAALQKGDEIVQVGSYLVRDLNFEEVVAELRGAPNSKVKITFLKPNTTKPVEVTLTRKEVNINVVTSLMYEGDIAYVKVSSFMQEGFGEMLEDIRYLYDAQEQRIKGMVLDLRDNPGGNLNIGLAVTGLFLENDKLILNVKSRNKDDKRYYKNRLEEYEMSDYASKIEKLSFLKTVPLIVLVNRDSAGGAEIVASVLQEYQRAKVIGTPTYGKDTFATLFPLSSRVSAVKFATARWSTPKGKSVWPSGVVPNIEVKPSNDASEDNALNEALSILRQK
ncbi:MAG: S41 family peptidase [Sulfurospirillum cavolei]|nr:S41 family peptidase [Sulfurospirillum cavolei]